MRRPTIGFVLVALIACAGLMFPSVARVQTSTFADSQVELVVGFDFGKDLNGFVAACGRWGGTLRVDQTRGEMTRQHCALPPHQDPQCNRPSIGYVDGEFTGAVPIVLQRGGTCGPRQVIFEQEVARVSRILGPATLSGSPATRATWTSTAVRCTINMAAGDPMSQTLISTMCVRETSR
ncbi:MAG: hypothetical protein IPK60_17425 [Sandaracinaceae bacterium]|jgi:hypothetical protein|nr:hypothetical protein [Sandaracinaceae bacterium]